MASFSSTCASAGLALCMIAIRASAEPAPVLTEMDYLGEMPVVLTASRLAQPIAEAPGAVTVIDREMIRASGFREIPDLFRLVPGFYVGWYDGTMATVNRGLSDQYSRRMQVLVDGRSIYTPLYGGVAWADLPLAMDDIERIEVVRGPNAATYGANAFMGIINIITRHPAEDLGTHVSLLSGDKGVGQALARYANSYNDSNYRLTASYQEDNGFDQKYDRKRSRMFSFRGDHHLNTIDSIQLQFGLNNADQGAGIPTNLVYTPHDKEIKSRFEQVKWERVVDADDITSIQFYHTYHETNDVVHVPVTPPYLLATTLSSNILAERYDLEFQKMARLSDSLRMVWGASYRLDKIMAPIYFNREDALYTHMKRLFGNLEWRIAPDWLLNAGALLENNDLTGTDTSPRVAVNYHLFPGHTLRASISKALRTPVLFEDQTDFSYTLNTVLGPVTIPRFRSIKDLQPEKIISREIGYLGNFGNYWSIDARVYQDRINSLIANPSFTASTPLGSVKAFYFDNLDSATIDGTEFQVKFRPDTNNQIIFSHNYTHSVSNDPVYTRSTPVHNFSVFGMHDFSSDVYGSFGYYRVGGMEALGEGDMLNAYRRLDLRLARRFKTGGAHGELAVVLQNVLDDYQDFRVDNIFDRRGYVNLSLDF